MENKILNFLIHNGDNVKQVNINAGKYLALLSVDQKLNLGIMIIYVDDVEVVTIDFSTMNKDTMSLPILIKETGNKNVKINCTDLNLAISECLIALFVIA